MRNGILLICFFFLFDVPSAKAEDFHPLFKGTRAQGMGNAFVAVADDEQAVFYNPAGLAGIKKFEFTLASADLDISNDLINQYPILMSAISNPGIGSLNLFMGKNIYARGQASASLVFPGFGIVGFADQQAAIRMQDPYSPLTTIGGQTTYGGQVGFGFTVLKLSKKKGELRMGFAGKMLWRGGGYQHPTLNQILTFNTSAIIGNMTAMGVGYGADTGLQFVYNLKKGISLQAGIAYTDLGNTSFTSPADPQLSNLASGVAFSLKNQDMSATLAFDYAHILESGDFGKKSHLGLELKFPLLSFYGGLNQNSLCYGAGIDFSLFKLEYVSYAEELSSVAGIDPERRNVFHFSMKLSL